jgi:hypothetical protein
MARKKYPSDDRKDVNDQTKKHKLTDAFWKNVSVIDATEAICLFPQTPDLEYAQPGDPENCVYAKCIKRVWPNSRRVRIWRGVALVETTDKHGQTIAHRYIISSRGKKALRDFDQGLGKAQPCMLLPPTPSVTLEGSRERARKNYPLKKEREIKRSREGLSGVFVPTYTRKHTADFNIRNGSGHSRAAV